MRASDFLVKFFGEHVYTKRELLRGRPEGNLGQNLIGEGARHDKRRMAGSTATILLTSVEGHFHRNTHPRLTRRPSARRMI